MPRDDKDDASRLYDMLTPARLVGEFVRDRSWEQYIADALLRSAVERQVGILGEAAWKTSADCKSSHPEIPWAKIAPARHRLIHDYDQIDDAIVWSIATKHIPSLVEQIEAILPPIPGDDLETDR